LNLGYSAEEELRHRLFLSLIGGLLQMVLRGEKVYVNVNHNKYCSYPFGTNL